MFQFPSNGKAQSDNCIIGHLWVKGLAVSIPFKREGTVRHREKNTGTVFANLLVSIPFKREGTGRLNTMTKPVPSTQCLFQFPSNGKAQSDALHRINHPSHPHHVSIPFKREGTGRLRTNSGWIRFRTIKFQFPSNGKAQADFERMYGTSKSPAVFCFNSLQTGRHRQTVVKGSALLRRVTVSIPFKREGTVRQGQS